MFDPSWQHAVGLISPYVVKISTPEGSGTGFLLCRTPSGLLGIATAAHVIDRAHEWEQPIRIRHHTSGKTVLLHEHSRAITIDRESDSAVILFEDDEGDDPIVFPQTELTLSEKGKHLNVGHEVGWVGFPSVELENLCFFSGRVSCFLRDTRSYLIDGVAISGVSGGPSFLFFGQHGEDLDGNLENLIVFGVISAYIPNYATGIALPGVAVVRDVFRLHEWAAEFRSLGEAKKADTGGEPPPAHPSSQTPPAQS